MLYPHSGMQEEKRCGSFVSLFLNCKKAVSDASFEKEGQIVDLDARSAQPRSPTQINYSDLVESRTKPREQLPTQHRRAIQRAGCGRNFLTYSRRTAV